MPERPRVVIVRNPAKQDAGAIMASLVEKLGKYATVQFTGIVADTASLAPPLPDRVFVLGGDGSILEVARALGDHQVPIVGVNFGKLGYLAEFGLDELERQLDAILNEPRIVSRRMMLMGTIRRAGADLEKLHAVNDVVVLAGPPFRMIEMAVAVSGQHLTNIRGDGIILATPSGSTAHNMSVGGPIIQSEVDAIALTPIAPHSLTHRPLVFAGDSVIEVSAIATNPGTTVVVDGQVSHLLLAGDRLIVRRSTHDFMLVRNPARPSWQTLIQKLKWGR